MSSEYIPASTAIKSAYAFFLETEGGADYQGIILPTQQGPVIEPSTDAGIIKTVDSEKPLIQDAEIAEGLTAPIQEAPILVGDEVEGETQITEGEINL